MAPDHTDAESRTLSEALSKQLLADFGLPVLPERLVDTAEQAAVAGEELGFPCVAKLCGDSIAHKTERNLVRLGIRSAPDLRAAAQELLDASKPDDGPVQVLVAPMVAATRELIVGADRSDEFGPVLMVGVGGIFAEVLEDVVFRLLPADDRALDSMLDDLRTQAILQSFRGEPAVDRSQLLAVLRSVAQAMVDRDEITSIDINPLMVVNGRPIAVDALVAVDAMASEPAKR